MRIITCASYYGTGSSAVTDLFSECSGVVSLGEYEYRFLQDPDGVMDLMYHISENNHRHNTGYAIKRFIKYVNLLSNSWYSRGYKQVFGDSFKKLSLDYVERISELYAVSWWHRDQIDRGPVFCFVDRVYSMVRRILTGNLKSGRIYSLLQHREKNYYSNINKETFEEETRKYIHELFSSVKTNEDCEFLMVDQLVPPTNTNRYLPFFDDIKVVVVERDPRDIYLLEKIRWQWGVIPCENVQDFVKWYRITRRRFVQDNVEKVIRIQFEDLIYDYNATCKKLFEFVGLDTEKHTKSKTLFVPDISIKGTNLKSKYPEYRKDIEFIEQELSEYLYDFPLR